MKPNPHTLPPGTFLPKDTHDPLRHTTQDLFWYHVEPHFSPVGVEDIDTLKQTRTDLPTIPPARSATTKTETNVDSSAVPRLQCYPLSQRLTAALLDEGRGQANAAKAIRSGLTAEDTWIGGTPETVRAFNLIMEERVRIELQQVGLLDPEVSNQLLSELRLEHWHLRSLISANTAMKEGMIRKVVADLSSQGARREQKIDDDHVEIKYLEAMIEKGGKRGKGRFNKLLNQMHPNRHLLPGDPVHGLQKSGSGVVGDPAISKKRKRKSAGGERVDNKSSEQNGALPIDAADNLAPHIADIIWKNNNQAPIDHIVKEFLERVPHLAGDIKEARRRITNCMSFSRKPFRFRKLSDGVTYSATRV